MFLLLTINFYVSFDEFNVKIIILTPFVDPKGLTSNPKLHIVVHPD